MRGQLSGGKLTDENDRACGVVENGVRDAADEKPRKTSTTVGAHHDQIRPAGRGLFMDGRGGVSYPNIRLTRVIHFRKPGDDDLHTCMGFFNGLCFE